MAEVYAYKNTEEIVQKSSSGGAFLAICNALEKEVGKGNVIYYGAAFRKDLMVQHISVVCAEECAIFQGAKYVESDYREVFPEVYKNLHDGKWVLFSGTPCQVAALKGYLSRRKIEMDRLVLLDLICHGTPKKEVWKDYRKWLEEKYNSSLIGYSFRYKPEGWKAYPAYAQFSNGKKIINTAETSVYSRLHMLGYSTTKKCFQCPFAEEKRQGDITLGDYWGIEKLSLDIPMKSGVSLILVHSDLGRRLMNSLIQKSQKDKVTYCIQTVENDYLKYQHNLQRPTEKPEKYEEFWEKYECRSFSEMLQTYVGYGFKYRILFAIKKMVRKTPLIVWYRNHKDKNR